MRLIFLCIVSFYADCCLAQVINPDRQVALPGFLKESSGIIQFNGSLISHNDGGNPPTLYRLNSMGDYTDSFPVAGVFNFDWEDISADGNKLYIAETGNNFHNRKNLAIYELSSGFLLQRSFPFMYGRQQKFPASEAGKDFDCEALLVRNDTAWFFSKSWAKPYHGISYLYRMPLVTDSMQVVHPIDSFVTGKKNFLDGSITGCDLSPDGKMLLLTTCKYLFAFFDFPGRDFFRGKYAVFRYEATSQREAVAFTSDSTFVVTDERWANLVGGNMYFYHLKKYLDGKIMFSVPQVSAYRVRRQKDSRIHIELSAVVGGKPVTVVLYNEKMEILETLTLDAVDPDHFEGFIQRDKDVSFARVFAGKKMIHCQRW